MSVNPPHIVSAPHPRIGSSGSNPLTKCYFDRAWGNEHGTGPQTRRRIRNDDKNPSVITGGPNGSASKTRREGEAGGQAVIGQTARQKNLPVVDRGLPTATPFMMSQKHHQLPITPYDRVQR